MKILSRIGMLITFFIVFISIGCTVGMKSASTPKPIGNDYDGQAYDGIKAMLGEGDDTIDYDTLLSVHGEMVQNQDRIPHSDELLSELMGKKNENPRVDNMIFILTADIIGSRQEPLDDVYGLFETMLKQDHRLNLWVLSYIGDAIGRYCHDIPEGDRLADLLEKKVAIHASGNLPSREFFGNHFLPPPQSPNIIEYIAGIEDQQTRERERSCYYVLIRNKWSEANIEKALRQLQTAGLPDTGKRITRPFKYLIQYPDQFQNSSAPAR